MEVLVVEAIDTAEYLRDEVDRTGADMEAMVKLLDPPPEFCRFSTTSEVLFVTENLVLSEGGAGMSIRTPAISLSLGSV